MTYDEVEGDFYIQNGKDGEPKKLGIYSHEFYYPTIDCYAYANSAGYHAKYVITNLTAYKKLTIGSISVNHESRMACILGDNDVELFKNNTGSNVEIDISNHSTITFCLYASSGFGNSQAVFTNVTIK